MLQGAPAGALPTGPSAHQSAPAPVDAAPTDAAGHGRAYPNAAAYGAYAQRQPQAPLPPAGAPETGEPAGALGHPTAGLVGRTVAEVERELILDTLEHTLGNRTHAANILGISIRTLRNKLRSYMDEGIQVPAPSASDRAHA
jgi:DNA-binding NtrC family response regulator